MQEDLRDLREINFIPYFLISTCIVIFDQISKYLVITNFNIGESIPLIKDVFHLTFILNKGIAFGLFKHSTLVSVTIAVFVIFAIFVFFIRFFKDKSVLIKLALSLILAGCIGNLIDRLKYGAIIDFLDFRIWPVFNIADSAISIGAFLVIFDIFAQHKRKKHETHPI